jgi:PPK2 family polyphosphate:nucleotide phosphotransferase
VVDTADLSQFRIVPGSPAGLAERPTSWLPEAARDLPAKKAKKRAKKVLDGATEELAELQRRFYAADRRALLLVFQALDAGGKDGTIRHVMSGVNPQGCQVYSFKVPSAEELAHDYLWRYNRALPERGRIGIFNRSHYEEVLVVRVHPELLVKQRTPNAQPTKEFWDGRLQEICDWERRLADTGTHIVKFFLHLSKDEQRKRFLDRIDDESKNWKLEPGDLAEREHWSAYQDAYEQALTATATDHAPWYVIPADRKYIMRSLVSRIVVDELAALDPRYPTVSDSKHEQLESFRVQLTDPEH